MKVNDLVTTHPSYILEHRQKALYCGSGFYDAAVVVSVKPFVLVSLTGDMVWYTKEPEDLLSLGEAHPKYVEIAQRRYCKDKGKEPELKKDEPPVAEILEVMRKGLSEFLLTGRITNDTQVAMDKYVSFGNPMCTMEVLRIETVRDGGTIVIHTTDGKFRLDGKIGSPTAGKLFDSNGQEVVKKTTRMEIAAALGRANHERLAREIESI